MELLNKIKDLLLNNDNSIQLLSLLVTMTVAFLTAYITSEETLKEEKVIPNILNKQVLKSKKTF